jgi:hypothetical protein
MDADPIRSDFPTLGPSATRWTVISGALGLAGLAAAVWFASASEHAGEVFFRSYLANFMFFLSLALGGLFFVLISHLTRAGWSVALRRLAEVVGWTTLPLGLLALVLLFGLHDLYEWTREELVVGDPLLEHKQGWLDGTFFSGRIVFYFVVWSPHRRRSSTPSR